MTPPGYTSVPSTLRMLQAGGLFMSSVRNWADVQEGSYAIVGSPTTVFEKLASHIATLGANRLLGLFQLGSLPHELTVKNLQLFTESVMPALKAEFPDGPAWTESGTAA